MSGTYDGIMSKTRQISVTLPEDLIAVIKRAVEQGEERSVSAYIARRLTPGAAMDALFSEWDAERGAPSAEDVDWADRELNRTLAGAAGSQSGAA